MKVMQITSALQKYHFLEKILKIARMQGKELFKSLKGSTLKLHWEKFVGP